MKAHNFGSSPDDQTDQKENPRARAQQYIHKPQIPPKRLHRTDGLQSGIKKPSVPSSLIVCREVIDFLKRRGSERQEKLLNDPKRLRLIF